MSKMYQELLEMAKNQDQPQRLLFLFTEPEGHNPKKSKKHQKGHLNPVMCVDKLPEEVESFDDLVKEADTIAKNWQFVFVSGLSGQNQQAPTTEDAEPYLNRMTNDLITGQNIARYLVLDRKGQPIEMMVN
ncbi:ribonucleotide reductase subunit alpha [Thalassotalea ganghwensis]